MTYKANTGCIPMAWHLIEFAIGAELDEAVERVIEAISGQDWHAYQNGFIAETVHCMDKAKQAFRLLVIGRPLQGHLFDGESVSEKYKVISNNRTENMETGVKWCKLFSVGVASG